LEAEHPDVDFLGKICGENDKGKKAIEEATGATLTFKVPPRPPPPPSSHRAHLRVPPQVSLEEDPHFFIQGDADAVASARKKLTYIVQGLLPTEWQQGSEEWQTQLHQKLTTVSPILPLPLVPTPPHLLQVSSKQKTGIGFAGGAPVTSDLGAGGELRISLPEPCGVGFIIGKQGATIKQMEATSGAKIVIEKATIPRLVLLAWSHTLISRMKPLERSV
jgi:hypothetical protein